MEAIIIKFVGKLITGLKLAASSIFGRLMAGAGMAFVTYQYIYPEVKAFIANKFTALPPKAVELLLFCAVDQFITMIVSALLAYTAARLSLVSATALESQLNNGGN